MTPCGTRTSASSYSYSELFESWCKEHGKSYASEEEKLARSRAFEDNAAFVAAHNAAASYALALNAFADLTPNEFRAVRLGLAQGLASVAAPRRAGDRPVFEGFSGDVPESIDWREKGAVTKVKDQGSCGYRFGEVLDGRYEVIAAHGMGVFSTVDPEVLKTFPNSTKFLKTLVSFGSVKPEQKEEVGKHGLAIYSWDEFLALGNDQQFDLPVKENADICTIMYTSQAAQAAAKQ